MHHSYGRDLDARLPESMAPSSAMMAKMRLSPLALSATAVATLTMLGSHPILSEAESGCMCVAQPCVDRDLQCKGEVLHAGHMWLTTLSRTPRLKCPSEPPSQSVWLPAPLRWPCARLRLQNLVHLDMFSGARSLQRMYCPTLTTMAMLAANSHVIKVITVCGTEVKLDSGGSAEASI